MQDHKASNRDQARKGIPLTVLSRGAILAALILAVVMIYATLQTDRSFQSSRDATDRYITCQQDAILFEEGSDYLTNEARYFVVSGDISHAENYANEVEVVRRRERALDDADSFLTEDASLNYLQMALSQSNALADVECYAMRLMAEGLTADAADYPDIIRAVSLTAEDAALTPEAQKAKALDLMFNSDYIAAKESIHSSVDQSIHALIEDTRQQMIDSTQRLNHLLRRQQILICLLLVLVLVLIVFLSHWIILPLRKNIRYMDQGKNMQVAGSREIRHLALVYNGVLADNNEKHQELSYSATHDALTGLYNRAAYDEAYETYKDASICVLVLDVDKFKEINDTYGHDGGDRALKKVSAALQASFRSDDHISRIGGDEFCVIMKNATSALKELVVEKVRHLNELLSQPEPGLPPISLSVGIAFADRPNPTGDIFKDADMALYRVKESGRGGCVVYS